MRCSLIVGILLLGAGALHAESTSSCTLRGKPFVARYATFTDGGKNDDSDITIYEVLPRNDDERKQACDDASLADFSMQAHGRVIRLIGKPASRLSEGVLAASIPIDDTRREIEPGTKRGVEISNQANGRKRLVIEAVFRSGSCQLDVPVIVCR
jgi:hypothetical protein